MTLRVVAVYGTLMRGCGNHRLLENSDFIGTRRTSPDFHMYNLGYYPYVTPHSQGYSVEVELYSVNKETELRLDGLEGYPNLYQKHDIMIDGIQCFMYVMLGREPGSYEEISTGRWKDVI